MLQKGLFIKQNQKSFDLPLACPPTGGSGIKKKQRPASRSLFHTSQSPLGLMVNGEQISPLILSHRNEQIIGLLAICLTWCFSGSLLISGVAADQ